MTYEEKRAWIMALVSAGTYGVYVAVILGRADGTSLAQVPYAWTLLWTVIASIVITIVLNIVVSIAGTIAGGRGADRKDERDREIHRVGEYIGHSFVIVGAVSALGMAMLEWPYFWIANVVFLMFVLSAVVASVAKIIAYRRGFQGW